MNPNLLHLKSQKICFYWDQATVNRRKDHHKQQVRSKSKKKLIQLSDKIVKVIFIELNNQNNLFPIKPQKQLANMRI